MSSNFAEPVRKLPEADIPLSGITAYLSQAESHQIIFMEFAEDVDLPEHSHEAQIGYVLNGQIDLTMNGETVSYTRGDNYYIPPGVPHSAKIHAGYADITFFDQPDRYKAK